MVRTPELCSTIKNSCCPCFVLSLERDRVTDRDPGCRVGLDQTLLHRPITISHIRSPPRGVGGDNDHRNRTTCLLPKLVPFLSYSLTRPYTSLHSASQLAPHPPHLPQ